MLTEALDPAWAVAGEAAPMAEAPPIPSDTPESGGYSEEDEAIIQQRLADLGYL